MKKRLIFFLAMLIAAAAVSGCGVAEAKDGFPEADAQVVSVQPTIQPADKPAGLPPIAGQVQPPEVYQKPALVESPYADVNVDAKILLPDADSIPQVQVSAADFTQEQLDGAIQYLFKGAAVYDSPTQKTKEELQEEIDSINRSIEKYGDTYGQLEQEKEYAAELEEQLKTAPETIAPQVSDGKLREMELRTFGYKPLPEEAYEGIRVYADLGKSEPAVFMVQNNSKLEQSVADEEAKGIGPGRTAMSGTMKASRAEMRFSNDAEKQAYYNVAPDGEDSTFFDSQPLQITNGQLQGGAAAGLSTTPQQALEQAQGLFQAMGVTMTLHSINVTTPKLDKLPQDAADAIKGYAAYDMSFVRNTNGIDSLYATGSSYIGSRFPTTAAEFETTGSWMHEMINVSVNDTGIISFEWWSPLTIKSTVPQEEELIPFSAIAEIFEHTMAMQYPADAPDVEIAKDVCEVNKVQLGYFRVSDIDSITDGTLVPAWGFYGYVKRGIANGEIYPRSNGDAFPFVLIDAQNGNVIDQMTGY